MIEDVTLTPAMVARDLAQALGERTHAAACLLVRAVRAIGPDAAYDLAGRALFIDATGGLRRRWFFRLQRCIGVPCRPYSATNQR